VYRLTTRHRKPLKSFTASTRAFVGSCWLDTVRLIALAVEGNKQQSVLSHIDESITQSLGNRSNHLQVQRGNPVRTFSGTDFKKNYQEKSFKKQRNQLKKELKIYKTSK
jgi:hypothetical protein